MQAPLKLHGVSEQRHAFIDGYWMAARYSHGRIRSAVTSLLRSSLLPATQVQIEKLTHERFQADSTLPPSSSVVWVEGALVTPGQAEDGEEQAGVVFDLADGGGDLV